MSSVLEDDVSANLSWNKFALDKVVETPRELASLALDMETFREKKNQPFKIYAKWHEEYCQRTITTRPETSDAQHNANAHVGITVRTKPYKLRKTFLPESVDSDKDTRVSTYIVEGENHDLTVTYDGSSVVTRRMAPRSMMFRVALCPFDPPRLGHCQGPNSSYNLISISSDLDLAPLWCCVFFSRLAGLVPADKKISSDPMYLNLSQDLPELELYRTAKTEDTLKLGPGRVSPLCRLLHRHICQDLHKQFI
ncbi:hypothetical protein RRG08_007790 [Elysia crispata]|uniref:Uncharacterized protein n=1 Tax=Elysia crispata TaxID=231223 RepID=A0AAE1B1W2_9GAST|nr:hypothetical protein RRG08_007790 [Elysia crispata]